MLERLSGALLQLWRDSGEPLGGLELILGDLGQWWGGREAASVILKAILGRSWGALEGLGAVLGRSPRWLQMAPRGPG